MSNSEFSETESNPTAWSDKTELPEISLSSILQALPLYDITLSVTDILKYSGITLGILIIVLYLFPSNIVIILLLMLLIVLLVISVIIKRANNTPKTNLGNLPINSERLQEIRAQFLARNKVNT